MLLLASSVVTIEAMGCQTKIVEKVVAAGAYYMLVVKENQAFLYNDIKDAFAQPLILLQPRRQRRVMAAHTPKEISI